MDLLAMMTMGPYRVLTWVVPIMGLLFLLKFKKDNSQLKNLNALIIPVVSLMVFTIIGFCHYVEKDCSSDLSVKKCKETSLQNLKQKELSHNSHNKVQ
jgi:hypothetical protein